MEKYENLKTLMDAKPNILNHNIETVKRLSPSVRARATYERSLELLKRAKENYPEIPTKSSIMIGLGETKEELMEAMDDLRAHRCGYSHNWSIFTTIKTTFESAKILESRGI